MPDNTTAKAAQITAAARRTALAMVWLWQTIFALGLPAPTHTRQFLTCSLALSVPGGLPALLAWLAVMPEAKLQIRASRSESEPDVTVLFIEATGPITTPGGPTTVKVKAHVDLARSHHPRAFSYRPATLAEITAMVTAPVMVVAPCACASAHRAVSA